MSTVEMSEGCEPFVAFYKRRAEAAESRVADLEAGIREVAGTLDADYDVKDDRGRRDAINYYARAVAGRLRALVDDEEKR